MSCVVSDKLFHLSMPQISSSVSLVRFFVTPWTVACQVPLSMEFSKQEYRSGLPFPSPVPQIPIYKWR